jgi:hypothetical protein
MTNIARLFEGVFMIASLSRPLNVRSRQNAGSRADNDSSWLIFQGSTVVPMNIAVQPSPGTFGVEPRSLGTTGDGRRASGPEVVHGMFRYLILSDARPDRPRLHFRLIDRRSVPGNAHHG